MKVIFESKSGCTKRLAQAMANAIKVEIWDLADGADCSKIANGELLFVGSPCNGGKCGAKAAAFLEELRKSGKTARLALFGTSFMKDAAVNGLRKAAEANGFSPLGDAYNCKGKFLFFNGGHPDDADVSGAATFAERLAKN